MTDKRFGSTFHVTHGMSKTRFYNIYHSAKSRCEYKKNNDYYLYGARGIKFMWKSFEEFKNDMYKSYVEHVQLYGEKDTTIDRIDSNKNYCKENCRCATNKEQANNISKNKRVEYNGKTYNSISLMCEELGLDKRLVTERIRRGRTIEEAIETKGLKKRIHDKQCKKIIYNGITYYSIMEASRTLGINYKILSNRLLSGWSVKDAIETPLKNNKKHE